MSAFTFGGPRNVLCTPALMSRDVRSQPTPEPTPALSRLCLQAELETLAQARPLGID